jgi:uncharacterized protein
LYRLSYTRLGYTNQVKPADVFDRDREWADLAAFAQSSGPGVRVGVVSGRRRTGKSYLLRRLAPAGAYYQALEEGRAPALGRLGDVIAARTGLTAGMVSPRDWLAGLEAVLATAPGSVVVIDELPYLLRHSPELLSALQRMVDDRQGQTGQACLIVCGSSLSTMSSLLSGAQPLRGRASLDLRLEPFDFRVARQFWAIADRPTALAVHAVLGGSPGYRDLAGEPGPSSASDLGEWLGATLFNPSHALYREDDYLLREEPRITERGLYQSIVAVIASGERTPSRIGGRLGRDRTALSGLLNVLLDAGFIRKDVDLASSRNVAYVVADPILRFCRLFTAPNRGLLDERRWPVVWEASAPTWSAQVLGPHLEDVTRHWLVRHASEDTTGGPLARVGRLTVADPARRHRLELDAAGEGLDGRIRLLAEVKATNQAVGPAQLARLEGARELLGPRATEARLMLVSLAGFSAELRAMGSSRPDVELVDLERLYEGD